MAKKVESIKHVKDTRAHIPSKEEAGYEDANAKVQEGKKVLELPKNPVVHRGQDPELFWLNKYGNDDRDDILKVDIRSLYRHEHIAPERLIENLYKVTEQSSVQTNLFNVLFGNALDKEEINKVSEYYHHQDGWTNRLIQGDSHLVMTSLLEREGMAGQVQMIYIDPPYGINYNKNWQMHINDRSIGSDKRDDGLSGEPEMIKAFRDTWELGIHSYLSYLRDRLIVAKELLSQSGSCFLQISDDNLHLVRCVLDEVFSSENFVNMISFSKAGGGLSKAKSLGTKLDYILWYAKEKSSLKFRPLFEYKNDPINGGYTQIEEPNGELRSISKKEKEDLSLIPANSKLFMSQVLTKPGPGSKYEIEHNGIIYNSGTRWWGTQKPGLQRLIDLGRAYPAGKTLRYKRYFEDFPYSAIDNLWTGFGGQSDQTYVVQTNTVIIERCVLMASDPGDLVLDPTCGSGTTAFVSEQFGRRWITIDTSRIAINVSKQRILSAIFPYYKLYDSGQKDIRQGFIYKQVKHITSESLANNEEPSLETLYDQPEVDKKVLRVSGPFTVETLQNFEPIAPEELDDVLPTDGTFEEVIRQHLLSAGIKNGRKEEMVVFNRVELLSSEYIHAEGFYQNGVGDKKAYFHIGPKFGTVSKKQVNEAIKECRIRGDAQWLVILGFSFESDIEGGTQTTNMGVFEVTKARIHDDLLQDGLKKKPAKSAASFVTIGEPDILLHKKGSEATVEIQGLDIYDPIKDEVKPRNIHDIAYWMVDDDYDGSNFIVRQVFFCGGDKDEFNKWKKGLDSLAKDTTKKKVEKTLKIEIDDEAFDRLYGHISHPIEIKHKGQKIAVRVVSQFGEEVTKVISI